MPKIAKFNRENSRVMKMTSISRITATVALTGAGLLTSAAIAQPNARLTDWPRIASPIKASPVQEARIRRIVASMTLAQKIGQMTQAEIKTATPEQARDFYLGSVLNGGGSWPAMHKGASAKEWAALADRYYSASMASDMKYPVPIIWGIDAVHGNNNVIGATLYPHNIGLGAAHDPVLVGKIAHATARAVRATGINWAFAPTLAIVQDERWGRSYEGFAADPLLVRAYAAAYVRGAQGQLGAADSVLATAKHFIGDGGTFQGKDQGENRSPLRTLINTHGQGYYGALGAGVQTVMVSYSSWNDVAAGNNQGKLHGSRQLITGALKQRMGFDGLVVSDWDAIEQVPGCTKSHCPQAINAGIDMIMVPTEWQAFIKNTMADVQSGTIPMARIDDAVSRIIRVKLRAGLFAGSPATGALAGDDRAMVNRPLARGAVRESLVLLKNQHSLLPLTRGQRVLVVGKSADSFSNQSGGWSRTWQGTENTNVDFTTGETLLTALKAKLGDAHVTYSADGSGVNLHDFDTVIAVIGEAPYAEYHGDIVAPASLEHSARYPEDRAVLDTVSGKGVPVVTVFYSGRTAYANDLINRSDAFVAAWLPGSEAGGIADVLFRDARGRQPYDFRGRLPFGWLGDPCDERISLFPVGYGLGYAGPKKLGHLPEMHGISAEGGASCKRVAIQ